MINYENFLIQLTHADLFRACVDSCWFVLIHVALVLTCFDSCWTRAHSCRTSVDLCWYSCIRIDLIQIEAAFKFNTKDFTKSLSGSSRYKVFGSIELEIGAKMVVFFSQNPSRVPKLESTILCR